MGRYAWRRAAPREFLINVVINAWIPWWLAEPGDVVPVLGSRSVAAFFLPMLAIMPPLTTFGAYLNTIWLRSRGRLSPPPTDRRWLVIALRSSVRNGLTAFAVGCLLVGATYWLRPDAAMTRLGGATFVGLSAGLSAAWLHGRAVVHAASIGLSERPVGDRR